MPALNSLLDALDRKILFELDCDSRQSFSDLARKVRHGRDTVEYRVERLIGRGIIRECTSMVNLYKLGLTIYKTYFHLRNERERTKEFFQYVRAHPQVYRVAIYDGNWDINVATVARTPRDFYEIHSKLITKFHDIVLEYAMYTLIDVWRFRKGYFFNKAAPGILTGGEPERIAIDQLEYTILKHIASNSRISLVELAEKTSSTPAVAKYRIEQLEKRGVIAGYRIEVSHKKLNMLYFKTQLFVASYQQRMLKQLFDFCDQNPHITYFISQLGECPVELELEVESLEQYHEIIDSLREKFSPFIQNFRSLLIHEEFFKWLPYEVTTE